MWEKKKVFLVEEAVKENIYVFKLRFPRDKTNYDSRNHEADHNLVHY